MKETRPHKIRLKLNGNCNKSCFFCHEEGDMKTILDFKCDNQFKTCMKDIQEELGIYDISLTGGEPTLNQDLKELVCWMNDNGFKVDITTNGSILRNWKDIPIRNATISIHSLCPKEIISMETKKRDIFWAENIIRNTKENIKRLTEAGICVRANIVAVDENLLERIKRIKEVGVDFEIRVLSNLNKPKESKVIIDNLISTTKAIKTVEYRRGSSSNRTVYYKSNIGLFSVKPIAPFWFNAICKDCPVRKAGKCSESFYGLRLERKEDGYYIRLCLYRNDKKVLIPYKKFLQSNLKNKYLKLQ